MILSKIVGGLLQMQTAIGMIKRYLEEERVKELPRGGRNNVKLNAYMKQCIEAIVNDNLILTALNWNMQRLPEKRS